MLKEEVWGKDPGSSIKEFPQRKTKQKKWACKADREHFQTKRVTCPTNQMEREADDVNTARILAC